MDPIALYVAMCGITTHADLLASIVDVESHGQPASYTVMGDKAAHRAANIDAALSDALAAFRSGKPVRLGLAGVHGDKLTPTKELFEQCPNLLAGAAMIEKIAPACHAPEPLDEAACIARSYGAGGALTPDAYQAAVMARLALRQSAQAPTDLLPKATERAPSRRAPEPADTSDDAGLFLGSTAPTDKGKPSDSLFFSPGLPARQDAPPK